MVQVLWQQPHFIPFMDVSYSLSDKHFEHLISLLLLEFSCVAKGMSAKSPIIRAMDLKIAGKGVFLAADFFDSFQSSFKLGVRGILSPLLRVSNLLSSSPTNHLLHLLHQDKG